MLLIIALSLGVYYYWQQNQTDVPGDTTSAQIYSDVHYSFEYPQDYTISEKTDPDRIEVTGPDGYLSIFQLKTPEGERVTTLGFGGMDPQDIPKKMKSVENNATWYDIWFYYDEGDTKTETELLEIYDSITLK